MFINVLRRCSVLVVGLSLFALVGWSQANEVNPFIHPLLADHAVLQRDARVPVWGWAARGAKITVRFAGQEKHATAGTDGKWMAYLDPMKVSSKPREMIVTSSGGNSPSSGAMAGLGGKARISDVLVGDVWICSGQSNMEMGIGNCGASNEIAAANLPRIRLLAVPKKIAYTPELTLQCAWLPCSPTTVTQGGWGGFSAAGYFFGRELHRDLDIPIGLIHTSWGGTICEAWTSREALTPLGDYKSGIEQVEQVAASPETDKVSAVMDKWYQAKDPGTSKAWFRPETDVSTWKTANMPANWQACGLPGYEGIVWVQRIFEAPAAWAGRELVLSFGPIGDVDTTWVNGIAVGRTDYFDQARTYKVPAAAVITGRNVIAMRVVNAGGGGFFGTSEQMKVYPSGDEGSAISLAGPWRVQDTATRASTGAALAGNPNICSVLYNGMIAPLIPFAIKGAVWYQGESNAERAYQYRALLPTMIKDWRSRFGVGDFGFHIVSLANYKPVFAAPRDSDWAELREAQAMAAKALPNCGIAMAIDIGEAADIHPRNKQEVGRRLALSALAITYGKKIEWSGPWHKSMKISGKGIRLTFDHAQSGLAAKGDKLTGFAIAGEDRKFVWADAVIDGKTVLVSSPAVPRPVAVRYGWDSNPTCNLFNKENLPAVPFRTDDWPGVTQTQ
jgi:sialate O-acetylesterase